MQRLAWLVCVVAAATAWSCSGNAAQEIPNPDCLQEIDHIIALAGVVLAPGIPADQPLPADVEAALAEQGLRSEDYETVFELNQHLILHSADGIVSQPGSADAVAELALLQGEDGAPNQWIVLYWRVRVPCAD